MNYYDEIKNKIIDNEIYCKVRDYSKEKNTIITYFEIGRLLNEAGDKYGGNIIDEYSKKLIVEVGKRYNRSTLFKMKKLYNVFSNEKVAPVVPQLTWSHCLILILLKDNAKIYYYAIQVKKRNLSKRQLEEIVRKNEYERLPLETRNKITTEEKLEMKDLVPDLILIKNKNNILLCYEEDKIIKGYIYLKSTITNNKKGFLIDGLYVDENYRNNGIATNLMETALSIIKNTNAEFININVLAHNKNAINLYKKFGFSEFKINLKKDL